MIAHKVGGALLVPFYVLTIVACSSSPASSPVHTYHLGEKAVASPLTYTVFDTQWLTHIGEGTQAKVPTNRYFVIRLSIWNGGSGEVLVPAMSLHDDRGQSYPELTDAEGVPNWIGYLRRIKANETLQGNIVFDVPPGRYVLQMSDPSEERRARVDLPLKFAEPNPIPVPLSEDKLSPNR